MNGQAENVTSLDSQPAHRSSTSPALRPLSPALPIAVPEARERQTLSLLLKNRGLPAWEVPLVSILDAPDPAPVDQWLQRFLGQPPDLFVLLTGEGLRRLLARAAALGLQRRFLDVLGTVPTLCRGPKPERVLRELGLAATHAAAAPTSAGVLDTAAGLNLVGKRVAVQLYGAEPNLPLQDGLRAQGASVDVVAPYVYAGLEAELKVAALIRSLALGEVAMLAFTSQAQVKRLQEVAVQQALEHELHQGLLRTPLAAVGPVVRDLLEQSGYKVAVMPQRVYFMKPLVAAITQYLREREAL